MRCFYYTKIKDFILQRSEYLMLTPVGSAVITFGKSVHNVIIHVRPGNIPKLPFPICVYNIGFVHASAFPGFTSDKGWLRLIDPDISIPFKITDCIGPPKILCSASIINSLHRNTQLLIPAFYISRTMPATF